MARRLFFSFHYDDVMRANIVRNCWLCPPARDYARSWDQSLWEKAKTHGDAAIKRLIDRGLNGTSVTVVLIGAQTAERRYVQYEIEKSYNDRMGLLGVYLHNIPYVNRQLGPKGANPFAQFYIERNGNRTSLSSICPTYDWVNDGGYHHFADWVETAAKNAGR